ncbi:MAG TPA: hypothetical protein VNA16_10220, partial [Abditibacteriaceae bacterium]|nr:hypothetical protein [Abditibacteriaceae bacterium]
EIDPATGMFGAEYADVYGIPFSIVPFHGKPTGAAAKPDAPLVAVKALPERKDLELRFPNVEGYAFALRRNAIHCDVASMQVLPLDPGRTPAATFVAPVVVAAHDNISAAGTPFDWQAQSRDEFYKTHHLQTVKFWIAQDVTNRLLGTADQPGKLKHQARHELFPQVYRFVDAYIGDSGQPGKVRFNGVPELDVWLDIYRQRIIELLVSRIEPDESAGETPLLPILNRFQPIGSTANVHFVTSRPVRATQKSHLSAVVGDTQSWEQAAAIQMELAPEVVSYARNDRLGLRIPYEFQGLEHFYEPDFLVQLKDDTMLLIEVKGHSGAEETAKHDGADRWRNAVNNWIRANDPDRIGLFRPLLICYEPQLLAQELEKAV